MVWPDHFTVPASNRPESREVGTNCVASQLVRAASESWQSLFTSVLLNARAGFCPLALTPSGRAHLTSTNLNSFFSLKKKVWSHPIPLTCVILNHHLALPTGLICADKNSAKKCAHDQTAWLVEGRFRGSTEPTMSSAAGPTAHVALRVFIAKEQEVQRDAQQAWDGACVCQKEDFGGLHARVTQLCNHGVRANLHTLLAAHPFLSPLL